MASDMLYASFGNDSPEGQRTIDFSGESLNRKANEYNMSVFESDGTPAIGTVAGTVTFQAFSPGSDRPETPATDVDLSTGCRKFNLFFASIERVVFSVSGLTGNRTLRVEAYRNKGLIVGSNNLNTLVPVNS